MACYVKLTAPRGRFLFSQNQKRFFKRVFSPSAIDDLREQTKITSLIYRR